MLFYVTYATHVCSIVMCLCFTCVILRVSRNWYMCKFVSLFHLCVFCWLFFGCQYSSTVSNVKTQSCDAADATHRQRHAHVPCLMRLRQLLPAAACSEVAVSQSHCVAVSTSHKTVTLL